MAKKLTEAQKRVLVKRLEKARAAKKAKKEETEVSSPTPSPETPLTPPVPTPPATKKKEEGNPYIGGHILDQEVTG